MGRLLVAQHVDQHRGEAVDRVGVLARGGREVLDRQREERAVGQRVAVEEEQARGGRTLVGGSQGGVRHTATLVAATDGVRRSGRACLRPPIRRLRSLGLGPAQRATAGQPCCHSGGVPSPGGRRRRSTAARASSARSVRPTAGDHRETGSARGGRAAPGVLGRSPTRPPARGRRPSPRPGDGGLHQPAVDGPWRRGRRSRSAVMRQGTGAGTPAPAVATPARHTSPSKSDQQALVGVGAIEAIAAAARTGCSSSTGTRRCRRRRGAAPRRRSEPRRRTSTALRTRHLFPAGLPRPNERSWGHTHDPVRWLEAPETARTGPRCSRDYAQDRQLGSPGFHPLGPPAQVGTEGVPRCSPASAPSSTSSPCSSAP